MVGHSSNQISKKGVIFNYYKCKNAGGSKPCKKKLVQKDYIENIIVAECRKRLTPKNIRKIAREIMRIAQSMEDLSELKRLEALLKSTEQAKENQMSALRQCQDATVRNMIFQDLAAIGAEIDELHRSIDAEKMRRYSVSEEQVIDYLNRIANGDAKNPAYRKALIKMFVNKIYLYDDRITITFQTSGEEVTISDVLLEKVEKESASEKLCLLNRSGHQKIFPRLLAGEYFFLAAPGESKFIPGRGNPRWSTKKSPRLLAGSFFWSLYCAIAIVQLCAHIIIIYNDIHARAEPAGILQKIRV